MCLYLFVLFSLNIFRIFPYYGAVQTLRNTSKGGGEGRGGERRGGGKQSVTAPSLLYYRMAKLLYF